MMEDHLILVHEGRLIYATHGHRSTPEMLPSLLHEGDVFLYGHVHLPIAEKKDGRFILNPGSITFPKQNNPQSYGILDEQGFTIYTLKHQVLKQILFSE